MYLSVCLPSVALFIFLLLLLFLVAIRPQSAVPLRVWFSYIPCSSSSLFHYLMHILSVVLA